jgi:hypothetical protein
VRTANERTPRMHRLGKLQQRLALETRAIAVLREERRTGERVGAREVSIR